jgi:outer membrane protein
VACIGTSVSLAPRRGLCGHKRDACAKMAFCAWFCHGFDLDNASLSNEPLPLQQIPTIKPNILLPFFINFFTCGNCFNHRMSRNQIITIILWVFVTVSIGILFVLHLDSKNKYVYVDSQKLVNGYTAMQQARKDFEAKAAGWQANLDTLRSEAEKKIKEYEATAPRLSPKERQLMEELIQSKQDQYANYQQVIADKIKQADQELTTNVLSKVNDYIKRYGRRKGYTIIMAATQYGNIIYAEDEADITEEVLKGLNAEYK